MTDNVCNFCGAAERTLVHTLRDVRLHKPGDYELVKCNNCGLLYLNISTNKSMIDALYNEEYHVFKGIFKHEGRVQSFLQNFGLKSRCNEVNRIVDRGKLLDVGCSTGIFLSAMRNKGGWEVYGVEPSMVAAKYASEQKQLNVFCGTLDDAKFPDSFFDAITLWDVLEHTLDPKLYLQKLYGLLKPGGLLVIKVPDPLCFEAKIFGSAWVGFEAPQHLFDFPKNVLLIELSKIGFECISIKQIGSEYNVLINSISIWIEQKGHIRISRVFLKIASSLLVRIFLSPSIWLLRVLGFNSSNTFFCRKPLNISI